jgi:hypothetical protein
MKHVLQARLPLLHQQQPSCMPAAALHLLLVMHLPVMFKAIMLKAVNAEV